MSKQLQENRKPTKINADLLALTYGSLLTQILKDVEQIDLVNNKLHSIGKNMGSKMIDEYLAKNPGTNCRDLRATGEAVASALKMFLNIRADSKDFADGQKKYFVVSFSENPLTEFMEIPTQYEKLEPLALIRGAIEGALEQVLLIVDCTTIASTLAGHITNEIKVELVDMKKEVFPE